LNGLLEVDLIENGLLENIGLVERENFLNHLCQQVHELLLYFSVLLRVLVFCQPLQPFIVELEDLVTCRVLFVRGERLIDAVEGIKE